MPLLTPFSRCRKPPATAGLKMNVIYLLGFSLLICSVSFTVVDGEYMSGAIDTKEKWMFLAKFCFFSEKGKLYYHINYLKKISCMKLLVYFSEKSQWPSVYKNSSKNCWDKEAVAVAGKNPVFILTPNYPLFGCQGEGIYMDYVLKMTNGDSFMIRHLSADKHGIFQEDILFLIVFLIIFGISVYFALFLKERMLLHATYQMFLVSIGVEVLSLFFLCVHFGIYAYYGVTNEAVMTIGTLLHVVSYLFLLAMLLLIGKGFTITRARIAPSSTIIICTLMFIYVLLYVWLYIAESRLIDPGNLHVHCTPDYCVTALQIVTALWFSYSSYQTLRHHSEKSPFYFPFLLAFSKWFLAVPTVHLLEEYVIVSYRREKIVNALNHLLQLYAYAVLLFLTRPYKANKRFPYHIDTSRIPFLGTGLGTASGCFRTGLYRNVSITSFMNSDISVSPAESELQQVTDLAKEDVQMQTINDAQRLPTGHTDSRFGFLRNLEKNVTSQNKTQERKGRVRNRNNRNWHETTTLMNRILVATLQNINPSRLNLRPNFNKRNLISLQFLLTAFCRLSVLITANLSQILNRALV
nr:PREDICTED: transmembrane protein 145-like isoform X3 [Latimeria chalumnae]|eukprot:XP_014351202.1 PREDICTED: transmembrane protein 145-like isoform X3 [Latimeria chalumnae]